MSSLLSVQKRASPDVGFEESGSHNHLDRPPRLVVREFEGFPNIGQWNLMGDQLLQRQFAVAPA